MTVAEPPTPLVSSLGQEFFKRVPGSPGVYLMLDERGELLYVGKAKNLRARLRSYARVTAGDADRRLVRLVSSVREIRWEERATEGDALARETELLRAVRPPFNTSQTERTEYFFIATLARPDRRLRLRLAQYPSGDEAAYGCYQFAARAWDAFPSLVRAIGTVLDGRAPSRPTRAAGAVLAIPPAMRRSLDAFLHGRSSKLLDELLAAGGLDGLALFAVRREVEVLRTFFELGPRATRSLRMRHGLRGNVVTPEQMDEILAAGARATVGVDVGRRTDRVVTPRGARGVVVERVLRWREEGLDLDEIASKLNLERIQRFRGKGPWRPSDVASVVAGAQSRRDTRTRS